MDSPLEGHQDAGLWLLLLLLMILGEKGGGEIVLMPIHVGQSRAGSLALLFGDFPSNVSGIVTTLFCTTNFSFVAFLWQLFGDYRRNLFDDLRQHAMADLQQAGLLPPTVEAVSQSFRPLVKGT